MAKKGIIESLELMTKEQRILYMDIVEALLRYFKDSAGTVLIDDPKMINSSKENGWMKMEFYFKVVK